MQKNNSRRKKQTRTSFPFWAAICLSTLVFSFTGSSNIIAGCIDLADEPLEIQSMGAPGMIMFVYDNSGSMGWSMMTNEDEGQFHVDGDTYSYLFDGESPNNSEELFNTGTAAHKMLWKSQWSGYNKVYYNSDIFYEPWPEWTNAEIDIAHTVPACAPQADPTNPLLYVVRDNAGATFNLNDTWETLDIGGSGDLDDQINTSGTIVDNTDIYISVSPILVDDGDAGFSYTGLTADWNFVSDVFGINGDWMNYNGDNDPVPVTVTWSFNVLHAGNYKVEASVIKDANRYVADYSVTHSSGTTLVEDVNQQDKKIKAQVWVDLGDYDFDAGTGTGTVEMIFSATSAQRDYITADAVRLTPNFTSASSEYFTGSVNWGTSTSAAYQYGTNYLWTETAAGEYYTGLWTAENLSPNTDYNAYARWVGNSFRSTAVQYTVDGTTVSRDQMHDSGEWMLLKDNISFANDIGEVSIAHTCNSLDNDRACADAVAFLPSSLVASSLSLDIVMAHYFVSNANGTFLVNLDGAIRYYQFTDDGDETVEDDELTEMTLAQAVTAGIVSGRSYAQERQNFANWFQFARSRDHVGRYAVAKLVESMGNIYFGMMTVPPRDVYAIRAVKETQVTNRNDTLEIYDNIYNLPDPSSSTPLKDSFLQVAEYFEGAASLVNAADKLYFTDGGYATVDTYPYLNEAHGGHCQQAFIIAMTDGLYNMNSGSSIPNHDGDNDTDWDGGEYADNYLSTLADIAMDFYEHDLKADDILIDEVPINEWDQNKEQHLVTYALSFGIKGNIDPANWPDCPLGVDCPDWPLPVEGELTTIDDMYHATVNGRGLFLNAGNPQELVEALRKIKENIEERLGSSAAVTTSSVQRQIGSKLYRGQYMTGKWIGDLQAFPIDVHTGAVFPDYAWSARLKLDELVETSGYTARKIFSSDGSLNGGITFEYSSMTADQKTRLSDGLTYAFGTGFVPNTESLVNYLRGEHTGAPFRARTSLLGDIVHSEAEFHAETLYVGANDGMLHAFDSETGVELGAYVPDMLYSELPKLAAPDYDHQYYVNNTPFVSDLGNRQLLVCPMSKGYKGLFVLDVSTRFSDASADKVALWEYPGAGVIDPDLGYTYSNATIFKTKAAGWVVISGNGYESTNGNAILYVFNALTGAIVKKFDTGVGGCNGMSSPAIIDPNSDGYIDYVYAGDLKGNMWKFDLQGVSVADWKIAFNDGTDPQPLITVTDPLGNPQPITNMPAVMFVNKCNPPGSKGFLIMFGTGKYLGLTDTADGSQQSVYAVYDWGPDWAIKTGAGTDANKYLGTFGISRSLPNADFVSGTTLNLVEQTLTGTTSEYSFISDNPVVYYNVQADAGNSLGWYMDFSEYKERMVRRPVIRNNIFIFITNTPEQSVCSSGGTSGLYMVDACTGGWPDDPQFDTDGDGDFDDDDLIGEKPPVKKKIPEIILDPTLLEDVLYLNDKDDVEGTNIPALPLGAWFWHVIE